MTQFKPFPKIPRLSREVIISEKIDGTNASVEIIPIETNQPITDIVAEVEGEFYLRAGSRNRWLSVNSDNFGFCNWVVANAKELAKLGTGHHFGEWWGLGIQRGYGLKEKRFSLFNTFRWKDKELPNGVYVVPELGIHDFASHCIEMCLANLKDHGSYAAPGYMNPEGIVIYHTAAKQLFKKTFEADEKGKEEKS